MASVCGVQRRKKTRNDIFRPGDSRPFLWVLFALLSMMLTTHAWGTPQESIQALAARAGQYEAAGKWEQAVETYNAILRIDPNSVAALNSLGVLYVEKRMFDKGIQYYRKALALSPEEFALNLDLGIAYVKMQDYKSAIPPLSKAAELKPSDVQAQELLAVSLVGRADYAHAILHLEKVTESSPNDLGAWYMLVRSYLKLKNYGQALKSFQRLESLSPSSPWIHILSGQAYDGLGQSEKALHEFQQARQELPDDPTVRFSLGFMDWKLHHFDQAIVELQATLRLDPQFDQAKFYLADSYLAEQKPGEALPIIESYAKKYPRDYRALVDLGKARRDLGQLQPAQQALRDAVRVNPALPEAHYLLASVDRKLHETKDAQRELALTQKLQSQKIEQAETLLNASGARGDPTRQLGIVPEPRKSHVSATSPH